MKRNGSSLLVPAAFSAAMLALSSCFLAVEKEREPNDDVASAQAVWSGKTIRGTLRAKGDVDYFRVASKRGGVDLIASISLREIDPIDLVIKLHEGGRTVKIIDDTKGAGERIVNALFSAEGMADGTAAFSVEAVTADSPGGAGRIARYELAVKAREREQNEEGEPNDKLVQATRIDPWKTAKGFFNPAFNQLSDTGSEEDWYAFRLEGRGGVIVNIGHSAVPDVDSVLSVYDGLGYLVREANSRGKGVPEKLTNILLADGEYYVKIAPAERGEQNREVGYLLKIDEAGGGPRESEPNDRYPFANPLAVSREVEGNFNPAGDEDWYRLDVYDSEPQILTVRVSPTAELDPVIDFFDSSQNRLLRVDSKGKDEGEVMRNMGVGQGVYYIRLSDKDKAADNPDKSYVILAEKKALTEDEELEPNDSLASAQQFTLGRLKRGFISPVGDRDWYSFQVEKTSRIYVEVSPCALIDFTIRIHDAEGRLLHAVNDNPLEEGERTAVTLPPGVWYVEVSSVSESENARDAYILRIAKG